MKVYITPQCHAQIMHYVNESDIEISGLGRVERDSKGNMVVTRVYLLDQENTGASTDIDEAALSKLMFETRTDPGALNFWWHSHVNMGVFWSGTDMATIRQFGKAGYLLSTVFNKKGEHRTSYFQGAGEFYPEIFVDQIETSFAHIPSQADRDAWSAEMKLKCKPKVYKPVAVGLGTGTYWNKDTQSFDYQTQMEFDEWEQRYMGNVSRVKKQDPLTTGIGEYGTALRTIASQMDSILDTKTAFENLSIPDQLVFYDAHMILFGYDGNDTEVALLHAEMLFDIQTRTEYLTDVKELLNERTYTTKQDTNTGTATEMRTAKVSGSNRKGSNKSKHTGNKKGTGRRSGDYIPLTSHRKPSSWKPKHGG